MRIIGGTLGGRRIQPPANKWPTRPTTDYAREALFNILSNRMDLESIKILDLFGGTGMISLEAISRGCETVTYVDRHRPCIKWVHDITNALDVSTQIAIISADVEGYLSKCKTQFDLIFADPPYDWPQMLNLSNKIFEKQLLAESGLLVIEHAPQTSMHHLPRWSEDRKYGSSVFSFFT